MRWLPQDKKEVLQQLVTNNETLVAEKISLIITTKKLVEDLRVIKTQMATLVKNLVNHKVTHLQKQCPPIIPTQGGVAQRQNHPIPPDPDGITTQTSLTPHGGREACIVITAGMVHHMLKVTALGNKMDTKINPHVHTLWEAVQTTRVGTCERMGQLRPIVIVTVKLKQHILKIIKLLNILNLVVVPRLFSSNLRQD